MQCQALKPRRSGHHYHQLLANQPSFLSSLLPATRSNLKKSTSSLPMKSSKGISRFVDSAAPGGDELDQLLGSLPPQEKQSILGQIKEECLPRVVFDLYCKLIDLLQRQTSEQQPSSVTPAVETSGCPSSVDRMAMVEDLLSSDKNIVLKMDMLDLRKFCKSGSFDVRMKFGGGGDGKELKALLSSQVLTRRAICSDSRGNLAVAEGDSVAIVDISRLFEDGASLDKNGCRVISKSTAGFDIVSLCFNAADEHYLVACGLRECRVFTLDSKAQIVDQLEVNLSLHAMGESTYIVHAQWIPRSKVNLGMSICRKPSPTPCNSHRTEVHFRKGRRGQ